MECPRCYGIVTDDCRYCTRCGYELVIFKSKLSHEENNTLSLFRQLAGANLARIRKEWDTATKLCTEVLQKDPEDASAHSLMGDILADQQKWDEALRWYELALDLDCCNESDKQKRRYALMMLARDELSSRGLDCALGKGKYCISWLRFGSIVGAAIVLIMATLSTVIFTWVGGRSTSLNVNRHNRITKKPVMARHGSGRLMPSPSQPSDIVVSAQTPSEDALFQQVRAAIARKPWGGVRITSLEVDPRTQWAWMSIYVPPSVEGISFKELLPRTACFAGFSLLRSSEIKGVTLRVVTEVPDQQNGARRELAFTADLTTRSPWLDPLSASIQQVMGVLRAPWWNPALKPN